MRCNEGFYRGLYHCDDWCDQFISNEDAERRKAARRKEALTNMVRASEEAGLYDERPANDE
jgi:hypothetical protein